jgi:hypothetical protein
MFDRTRDKSLLGIAACVVVAAVSSGLSAQEAAPPRQPAPKPPVNDVSKGYIAAPLGSETLSIDLEDYTIQLFDNPNFQGAESTVNRLDNIQAQGKANHVPGDLNDKVSSIRWSLPPGGIVVFYKDPDLLGEQLVLWGSGQVADLGKWDFNDKASRWAWFNVGGAGTPLRGDSSTILPLGGETLSVTLTDNTIQLFKDKSFRSDMKQISPVSGVKAGELQFMPSGLDDSATSAQWNLPPGVIVMLYENPDGKRNRVALWGSGEVSDLGSWDLNDKASRWSWAYIGAAPSGR